MAHKNRWVPKKTREMRRADQIALIKVIGSRMIEARNLCGYTQLKAAELLGYSNSSKLNKIENATDLSNIPHVAIIDASRVYGVSIDYLYGLSDDWERDINVAQERQLSAWLFESFENAKKAEISAFYGLKRRQDAVIRLSKIVIEKTKESLDYVLHLQNTNDTFNDMRGGSKLLYLLTSTCEQAMGIDHELGKIRSYSNTVKALNENLDIFKDVD